MAAILCRYCFVEPCKACGKCFESCCKCMGSCCECFGSCLDSCCSGFTKCCDSVASVCDKPFSGCVLTSVSINLAALIYGIVGVVSGGSQCNKPLIVLGILLLLCTIINSGFSYYMYRTINHDENNPLFNSEQEMTAGAKLLAFFKYDKWMAFYIIFVLLLIALLCTSIVMAGSCSSALSNSVFWVSVIIWIYIGTATLILMSYVAFAQFREWAKTCWCWMVPCCWLCLCIGSCLNCAYDLDRKNDRYYEAPRAQADANNLSQTQPQSRSTPSQQQPVQVVVQQPVQIQPAPQQVMYTQPQQPVQTMTYGQPPPQQQQQQPMYNPQGAAPIQPGVVYMHQQPQQQQQPAPTNTYQTQPSPQEVQPVMHDENANDEEDGIDYDEIKEKGKKAAKAAGKQAKKAGVAALGWMTKKVNQLNDKVQENNDANAPNQEGQEGNNANQQTY